MAQRPERPKFWFKRQKQLEIGFQKHRKAKIWFAKAQKLQKGTNLAPKGPKTQNVAPKVQTGPNLVPTGGKKPNMWFPKPKRNLVPKSLESNKIGFRRHRKATKAKIWSQTPQKNLKIWFQKGTVTGSKSQIGLQKGKLKKVQVESLFFFFFFSAAEGAKRKTGSRPKLRRLRSAPPPP